MVLVVKNRTPIPFLRLIAIVVCVVVLVAIISLVSRPRPKLNREQKLFLEKIILCSQQLVNKDFHVCSAIQGQREKIRSLAMANEEVISVTVKNLDDEKGAVITYWRYPWYRIKYFPSFSNIREGRFYCKNGKIIPIRSITTTTTRSKDGDKLEIRINFLLKVNRLERSQRKKLGANVKAP